MSYCVNCGVKLAETEKFCPLCGVEVVNPRQPVQEPRRRNYPEVPVRGYKGGYQDLVLPLALLMLIPVLITLACDWLTSGALGWSIFVAASIGLAAVFILPPLALKRPRVLLCLLWDLLATIGFLYVLDRMTTPGWFLSVGLPLALIAGAMVLGLAALFARMGLRKLVKLALVLFASGLMCVFVDLFTSGKPSQIIISWSVYPLVPCVILGVIALLVNRNQYLREKIKQRFFV
jgi:4-amino-4-deoxy-L-arabinose transferase-like glycosyltransferase